MDDTIVVSLEDIQLDERLSYVERNIVILDHKTKKLQNKEIMLVKVREKHKKGSKWTWQRKEEMCSQYPKLF